MSRYHRWKKKHKGESTKPDRPPKVEPDWDKVTQGVAKIVRYGSQFVETLEKLKKGES